METLKLEQIQEHFQHLSKNKVGKFETNKVRTAIEDEHLGHFAKELYETRLGLKKLTLKNGKELVIPAKDLSFHKGIEMYFGTDMNTFMKSLGVDLKRDSFSSMCEMFGGGMLNKNSMEEMLINGNSFGSNGVTSTKDFPSDFRFIIPEVFSAMIRVAYEHAAMHQDWIATTQPMTTRKLTMPRIERGDGMPSKIAEGGDIPVGSLRFGKKDVSVFKVGTGFVITDELMFESTIDMVSEFLREVGIDMAIGADVEAMRVLVSGEQADGSESAPVVGVTASGTIDYKAMKRIFTRMQRLRRPADRLISGEEDGINITGIDRFEGFQGQTKLADIRSIIGVPERFIMDTHVLPANQTMFLSSGMAMAKLQYRSMTMERRRNEKNQTNELYVSDHIGFAILRRDARVMMDKSLLYSSNGFPSYMDIDARIAEAFSS
jgi:hypothetical protein